MPKRRLRTALAIAPLSLLGIACARSESGETANSTTERLVTTTTVPGRVEAESYALGGEGSAYHVAHGDWSTAHPRSDSMDIGADAAASGGYAIGWIDPGQWYAYDVNAATTGTCTLSPRVTAPWQPGALHIQLDGVDVTGELGFSTTSGWLDLAQSAAFPLTAGAHRFKVLMDGHGFNLDSFDVDLQQVASSPWVPAGYDLVFDDEFEGATLDTGKWWTRYPYAGGTQDTLNDEAERYRENGNHVMTGSTLKLTAYKNNPDSSHAYSSGMVRAKTLIRYGYLEARVKMPKGIGAWPAFWMVSEPGDGNPNALSWPPEIDIFEFVNNGVEDRTNMLHTGVIDHGAQTSAFLYTDPNFNSQWTYWTAPFDFTESFHVIGLLWDENDQVTTYVDGTRLVTRSYHWLHDDASDAAFANVQLNYAIGGQWAGRHGIDDTVFPQAFEIDYVRVYQKASDHRIVQSSIGVELCPPGGGC
ncbi:MAG TPA: family 16 glycosylhydrolase [Polyangiaceae bacterium]|nr:family 16 glycosylhydrolase [Polyangiaceae bacterium]